jgi:hypothetical protein
MPWFEQGMFWHDTRCTNEIVDYLERYLLVQSGKVVGLKWCLRFGMGWKVSHLRKVVLKSERTDSRE